MNATTATALAVPVAVPAFVSFRTPLLSDYRPYLEALLPRELATFILELIGRPKILLLGGCAQSGSVTGRVDQYMPAAGGGGGGASSTDGVWSSRDELSTIEGNRRAVEFTVVRYTESDDRTKWVADVPPPFLHAPTQLPRLPVDAQTDVPIAGPKRTRSAPQQATDNSSPSDQSASPSASPSPASPRSPDTAATAGDASFVAHTRGGRHRLILIDEHNIRSFARTHTVRWRPLPNCDVSFFALSAKTAPAIVLVGDTLYCFGGSYAVGQTGVRRISLAAASGSSPAAVGTADAHFPYQHAAAVVLPAGFGAHPTARVVLCGGTPHDSFASSDVWCYDTGTHRLEQWRSLREARAQCGASVWYPPPDAAAGAVPAIFVAGGNNARGQALNTLERLELPTESNADLWTREWSGIGSSLAKARIGPGVCTFEDRIWVIAGLVKQSTVLQTVEIYDPVRRAWSDGPTLGAARYGFSTLVVD